MKKYLTPEYANAALEAMDVITVSELPDGVDVKTETRVDPETGETYDATVYSLSSRNLF